MKFFTRDMKWFEVLVVLLVVAVVLLALASYSLRSQQFGFRAIRQLSNARQFHVAIQAMTADNVQSGNSQRWTCSNSVPLSFSQLTNSLVSGGYVSERDLRKLLTAPHTDQAFTFFAVTDNDPEETLLLATQNWHGMESSSLSGYPFQEKGFIVMQKGGDGKVLQPKFINAPSVIGDGGKFNYLPLK